MENGARFGLRYAVANQWDPDFCPSGTCSNEAEEQAARLDSIKEAAFFGSSSILRDLNETDWAEPTYFEVTVCSESADDYVESRPAEWAADWTADCVPGDDGGDEGDQVWVTVDFNHPVIAPFLSSVWPQLHLTSRRDGVVEGFRTVRFVGAGPWTPAATHTPSVTPTPSDTPTPTNTLTPTSTLTPSLTPSITLTPSDTPPPDCDDLIVVGMWRSGGDDLNFRIYNGNLTSVALDALGGQLVKALRQSEVAHEALSESLRHAER